MDLPPTGTSVVLGGSSNDEYAVVEDEDGNMFYSENHAPAQAE